MNYFSPAFALLTAALFAFLPASAQITIDEVDAAQERVTFEDKMRSTAVDVDYFSRARYRAERAAIRKERNFLEITSGLQGTLTSHNDPWIKVSGGDNAIALVGSFYLRHTFSKNLFSIETKVNASFGYNRMKVETTQKDSEGNDYTTSEGMWYKIQDELSISTAPSFKLATNWTYGAIIQFRTQFANGYISRTQQAETDMKSTFMAPGYLDVSFGITYKSPKPKFPISVNMSPIALNAVFVENRQVRGNTWDGKKGWEIYGLADPDKTSKYEGGSSIQIDFDRTFDKKGIFRYRTMIYSFYGWITNIGKANKISDYTEYRHALDKWNATENHDIKDKPFLPVHPLVRWENTLSIKATKFISTEVNFKLYYNRAEHVDVRTQTMLTLGLTYTFRNK